MIQCLNSHWQANEQIGTSLWRNLQTCVEILYTGIEMNRVLTALQYFTLYINKKIDCYRQIDIYTDINTYRIFLILKS